MTRALAIGLVALLVAVPVLPAGEVHALPILADMFSEPRPFTEASAPSLPEKGAHVVAHVKYPTSNGPYGVLRLVNAQGEEVMHALGNGALWVSDGLKEDGAVRYVRVGSVGGAQIDVIAQGEQYWIRVGSIGPLTLRAFNPATVLESADPGDLAEAVGTIQRLRYYPPEAALESFAVNSLAGPDGWQAYDPGDRLEVKQGAGHLSYWRLEVRDQVRVPGLTLEEQAYVHADVTAYGGRYIAEASFRPWAVGIDFPDGVPDHQAIVAGLSGPTDDPTVGWALTAAAQEEKYDQWSFYLVDGDGHRTRVSDTWRQDEWHAARVFVDEDAGTLAIQVDEGDTVKVFEGSLPSSDRVATGDVWIDDLRWTGIGWGYYDILAVTPWEVDA